MRHVREEFAKRHGRPNHLVFASPNETLSEIVTKLTNNHVHRLYILDDAKKPIGLVSLKDLLAELLN